MQKLSVIVPCRNGESYLGDALDSILSQAMAGVEIIVVDDGSTDASAEIARSRGPNIQLIRQEQIGASAARQAGMTAASGEWMAFCDADDLWSIDRMPAQLDFMESTAGIACCGLSQSFLTAELRISEEKDWTLPPEYHRTFSGLLIARDVVQRIGRLPEDGPDLHIHFFAALQDIGVSIERFERVVTLRRVHRTNYSLQGDARFGGYARAIKGVLERRRSVASASSDRNDLE